MNTTPPPPLALSLRGLKKTLGGADRRFIMEAAALDLPAGRLTVLTGPSGSGKSTLLELIGLASRPDAVDAFTIAGASGEIDIAGLIAAGDVAALAEIRATGLGFVLQTGGLLPFLTVVENLDLAQKLAGRPDAQAAHALLDALGIADLASAWPAALSVGQRQRAAVARALAHRPALLLADEPTAALDPENKARAAALVLDVAERFGAAVLVATHERGVFAAEGVAVVTLVTQTDGGDVAARLEIAA